jgi:integrase/recombinase XerD
MLELLSARASPQLREPDKLRAFALSCRHPYYPSGKRFLLRFKEKGGKEKELPVHHKLEELLDQYLKITGLEKEPESPLFPTALVKTGKLSRRPLVRTDAAHMLKRRLKRAGLPPHYSPHSFRATGITNFLEKSSPSGWLSS